MYEKKICIEENNSDEKIDNSKIKDLIHDIRNMKILQQHQINKLKLLNKYELIRLIYSYDNMFEYINNEILINI